jgi:hypothetical protein
VEFRSSKAARDALVVMLCAAVAGCSGVERAADPAAEPVAQTHSWSAAVGAALAVERYQPRPTDAGVQGTNPAQDLRFVADAGALTVSPSAAPDGHGLRVTFAGWGRQGALDPVSLPAPGLGGCVRPVRTDVLGACLARIEQAGDGVRAWWENTPEGLRQGWTLQTPPAGDGALVLEVVLSGADEVAIEGPEATFHVAGGALRYAGLDAWDATGRSLPSRLALTETSGGAVARLVVDDAGATWPVTVDPLLTTAAWTVTGTATGLTLGARVSSAGDLNGDGIADLVVGMPAYSQTGTNRGQIRVYYGASTGPATTAGVTWTGTQNQMFVGNSVDMAGDLNGDGYGDLVVGAPGTAGTFGLPGRVFVFYGGPGGIPSSPSQQLTTPGSSGDLFGWSVAGAGDVNNDGYGDLVVGAPECDGTGLAFGVGCAHVFLGAAGGLSSFAVWSDQGGSSNGALGTSVDGAGDVNGDGYHDLVLGAPDATTSGQTWVVYGGVGGPQT